MARCLNWTTTTLSTFYQLRIWTAWRHLGYLRDLPCSCCHGSRLLFRYIRKGLLSHGLWRCDGTSVDITLLCKRSGRLMRCVILWINGSTTIELTSASIVLLDWKLVRWFSREHFLWSLTRTRLLRTRKLSGCCLGDLKRWCACGIDAPKTETLFRRIWQSAETFLRTFRLSIRSVVNNVRLVCLVLLR